MKYIIFDLEATCWNKNETVPGPSEIIEIGAVKLDYDGLELDRLEQFIKPTHHPILSNFCKELTSISQEQIESAPYFAEAIQIFRDWIGNDNFILCSWGGYDRRQLVREAEMHGLQFDWFEHHINLKEDYTRIKKMKHQKSLKKALIIEKMKYEGTHHRGIDDAVNIAKIFTRNLKLWKIK